MEHTSKELLHKIDKKTGIIEEQINGVNRRLDILNGKTDNTIKRVDLLESWKDTLKGKLAVIAIVVSTIISITTAILLRWLG